MRFKIITALGFGFLYLIAFFLFSAIVAHFNEPEFKKIDQSQLPTNFPVAVYWETASGEQHCRGFWLHQLEKLNTSLLSYQLNVPASTQELCNESTKLLEKNSAWPVTFKWERKITWPFASINIDRLNNSAVTVFYTTDDDHYNKSRYTADGTNILEAEHKSFSGPGLALKAMPYGLLATFFFWMLVRYIVRWYKNTPE
ncbi:hypothetical protein ACFL2V_14380 [Pseudomonadota bacterium]